MSDEDWNNRFSPLDDDFIQKAIDLKEERQKWKHKKNKYKLTEEDKKVIEEQKETAKDMEQFRKKELLLRQYAKDYPIDDYTMLLYRLPLTETQMEEIHKNLLKENNK